MPVQLPAQSPEITYTALSAALTGVLWVPIIVNRIGEMGMWTALKNPQPDVRPEADWAYRLANAHRNAIENLAVFAPLALAVYILGLASPLTAGACAVFFASRLAHAVIYTFGVPLLRTIAFAIGFGCQVVLFLRIFGLV
jgi:uncharacterized MAPEG superfamily protein